MKPRRTVESNRVYRLAGGTEDNDLWVTVTEDVDGVACVASAWEPSPEERQAIADGANVGLVIWGLAHPPVAIITTDVELKGVSRT